MIRRLRNKFIRIATLSVAAVMLVLTLILNLANVISTDSDLRQTLDMIYENEGTIPQSHTFDAPPDIRTGERAAPAHGPDKGGPFNQETPFSTRYFVLRYQDDGTLNEADLNRIAAVTSDTVGEYLAAALTHGEGHGMVCGWRCPTPASRLVKKIYRGCLTVSIGWILPAMPPPAVLVSAFRLPAALQKGTMALSAQITKRGTFSLQQA